MMIVITMLMYTVSFAFQLPACAIIHNQCSNIKLTSPVYFSNGTVFPKLHNQQIDAGTKMKAYFEIEATQNKFVGVLLYKLQRYSDQTHTDIFTAKAVTKPTCIQILVTWKMKYPKSFAYIVLLKNIRGLEWNEEKLKKFYNENHDRLKRYSNSTSYKWLIDDKTVLKTTFEVNNSKRVPELNICISEEKKDDYVMRPLWVDVER
jgi:hypothetical protein